MASVAKFRSTGEQPTARRQKSAVEAPEATPTTPAGEAITCPVCGGTNPPDAVFCGNTGCRKALGNFQYVIEALRAEAQWHHVLADRVTALISKPHCVAAHVLWLVAWVALNTGVFAFVRSFDEYPFFLLVTILAIETLLITIFVLISNIRQSTHADKRAECDYEVSVQTYREITKMSAMMQKLVERLER
jgi:uncharacterized protein DUF1003